MDRRSAFHGSKFPPVKMEDAILFCIYARKSEEADERQALSIDSQIKELTALAKRDGLHILETRTEAHSAKASGQRPVFMQLLQDVREGQFSGILTWLPDRLSRNAGDLGKIVDLMDQGKLREIRTLNQVFRNQPNDKFLLMILCSQAKLENDNRGINVKRGQRARAATGHRPCKPPVGYILKYPAGTTKSKIVPDPIRAPVIRKLFRYADKEGLSGRKIHAWLREIGFTTPTGKFMPLSMIQRTLRNSFYTGRFEWPEKSGQWYDGDYEPLVSKAMFERIGKRLDLTPRYGNWGHKRFAFSQMLVCGLCGCGIGAVERVQELKDGTIKRRVYYKCTGSSERSCRGVHIEEEALIEQLQEIVEKVDLEELGLRPYMESEIAQFERFAVNVMGHAPGTVRELPKVSVRAYAKYILRQGKYEDRKILLSKLKKRLALKVYPRVVLTETTSGKKRQEYIPPHSSYS